MSRSPYENDAVAHWDAAATAFETHSAASHPSAPAHDPFGPVGAFQPVAQGYEAQAAPVFASPSLVPAASFAPSAFDLDDDELPVGRKRPIWMLAASTLAIVAGLSMLGVHFAEQSHAEEQRVAEIEQVRQRMVELEAKQRAEEAERAAAAPPTQPTSTVAALLSAGVSAPGAEKPRGVSDARQAAAIKRALSQPAPARRGRLSRPARHATKHKRPARDASEGLHENRSNDPIYGL